MSRQKLYLRAKRNVENRRQAAEIEALRRKQQLFAQHPKLQEFEREIAQAGALAASLAANADAENAKAKLAEVKELLLQKQKYLAKIGKANGFLEPVYTCPSCKDTGKSAGKICQCVQNEIKRLRREEIHQSGALSLCRFETFKLDYYPEKMQDGNLATHPRRTMAAILQDCKDWAAEFGPRSPSLYMFGYSGLGKTHLALAIAAEVLENGHDVVYVSAQSAFSALVHTSREEGEELFLSMLEAELLVLDDLGTENVTPYLRARLYELVNGRMGKRPTIYTSNICKHDILEGRYDEKIASRLLGDCQIMRFWGRDIRLAKAEKRGGLYTL